MMPSGSTEVDPDVCPDMRSSRLTPATPHSVKSIKKGTVGGAIAPRLTPATPRGRPAPSNRQTVIIASERFALGFDSSRLSRPSVSDIIANYLTLRCVSALEADGARVSELIGVLPCHLP